MGLIARALEIEGIATATVAWNGGRIRLVNTPRAIITKLGRGVAFGGPGNEAQQRRVLSAALSLLSLSAPLDPIYMDESFS